MLVSEGECDKRNEAITVNSAFSSTASRQSRVGGGWMGANWLAVNIGALPESVRKNVRVVDPPDEIPAPLASGHSHDSISKFVFFLLTV